MFLFQQNYIKNSYVEKPISVNFAELNIFNVHVFFSGENSVINCSAVTVGTFDGIHRGHQHVIHYGITLAKEKKCSFVVYTFSPHPRKVLGENTFKNILTQQEKLYLFEQLGVDYVYVQTFTKEFSQKSAQEFIKEHLLKQLALHDLIIGYDHQFGKNREGSYDMLKEMATEFHFHVHRVEAFYYHHLTISSTKIRNALEAGNIQQANEMLGYPFFIHATVVNGMKLGRKLGFPTANLQIDDEDKIIPATGVYAVLVEAEKIFYKGIASISYRHSVDMSEHPLSVEVHLFDFNDEMYDKAVNVFFFDFIRSDIKFDSLDLLKHHISQDIEQTKTLFIQYPEWLTIQNNLFLFNK